MSKRTVEDELVEVKADLVSAVMDLQAVAKKANDALDWIDEIAGDAVDRESTEGYVTALQNAVHALHEQAHGNTALRTCMREPCRSLQFHPEPLPEGPAALVGP